MQEVVLEKTDNFVIQTFKVFTLTLILGSIGAFIGVEYSATVTKLLIPLIVLQFVFLILVMLTYKFLTLNMIYLIVFVSLTGITLGPIISSTLEMSNGPEIMFQALALTALSFVGLTIYASTTKRDFTGIGKYLMIALLVVIGASIINIFWGTSTSSLVLSSVTAILFSFITVHDIQSLYSGKYKNPVQGAISLYLSVLNLFISLLNILRIVKGEK